MSRLVRPFHSSAFAYLVLVRPKGQSVTIRDYLNQQMRRSTVSCWLMIPPAIVALFAISHPILRNTALLVGGGCVASDIYHHFAARCPRCRTRLLLGVANGMRLKIPSRFNSCPTCGLSFDTQLDGEEKADQKLQPTAGHSGV